MGYPRGLLAAGRLVRRDAHLAEDLAHNLGIDAAVVRHVLLAPLVNIYRAH